MTFRFLPWRTAVTIFFFAVNAGLRASENVAHAPFAEWADVAEHGQLIARLTYQESEAYYFWAGHTRYQVDWHQNGEHYGIDINQGYLTLQYGLNSRWTADLTVGYTTAGWRFFSNFSTNGTSQSTEGLMDTSFGFRYQIFKEGEMGPDWAPTLTFRAGAVVPGSFDQHFPFAPGNTSTAIEPELLARKHFGWEGFGAYADGLFRWNHTAANDQYIVSIGLFQKIKRWELDAGYQHLGSINGDEIHYDPETRFIDYPRAPRENRDSIEAGFSYNFLKRKMKAGFFTRTVFDGVNTDKKFWLSAFFEMPFAVYKPSEEQ